MRLADFIKEKTHEKTRQEYRQEYEALQIELENLHLKKQVQETRKEVKDLEKDTSPLFQLNKKFWFMVGKGAKKGAKEVNKIAETQKKKRNKYDVKNKFEDIEDIFGRGD